MPPRSYPARGMAERVVLDNDPWSRGRARCARSATVRVLVAVGSGRRARRACSRRRRRSAACRARRASGCATSLCAWWAWPRRCSLLRARSTVSCSTHAIRCRIACWSEVAWPQTGPKTKNAGWAFDPNPAASLSCAGALRGLEHDAESARIATRSMMREARREWHVDDLPFLSRRGPTLSRPGPNGELSVERLGR